MKTKKELKDITYTLGYQEGYPITETISVQEQKDIIADRLTVDEIINFNIQCYAEWQRDC